MKRLVSLLLVLCMLVPCLAHAEQFGDSVFGAGEDVFAAQPEEIVQAPAEEDVVLPEADDLLILPTEGVDGPDPYRELVLLQPTDLFGTAIDVSTIRLSWGPVAFATQYDVYRKLIGKWGVMSIEYQTHSEGVETADTIRNEFMDDAPAGTIDADFSYVDEGTGEVISDGNVAV